MHEKKLTVLSRGQLIALGWVALLSPIIRQLPRSAVHAGGRSSWLSPLLAWFPLLLYILLLQVFLKNRSDGEGLRDQFCKALGEGPGRVVLALYTIWLLFYMGFVLRAGADRFIAAVYPNSRPAIFILVMAGLGLMAGLGRLKVLARCAEVTQPLLLFFLLLVALSALPKVDTANLLPVSLSDLDEVSMAALPVANTLTFIGYAAFLEDQVEKGPVLRSLLWPLTGTVLLVFLLCFVTIGSFGAELTGAMRHPFFVLIRDVRLFNLLERIESLIIVQWVVADFVLVSLLAHICSANLCRVFHTREETRPRWAVPVMAAGVAAAFLCAPTSFALQAMAEHLIPLLNALFLFVLLPLIFCIGKLRKKI